MLGVSRRYLYDKFVSLKVCYYFFSTTSLMIVVENLVFEEDVTCIWSVKSSSDTIFFVRAANSVRKIAILREDFTI